MQSGHLRAPLLKKELKGEKYLVFHVDISGEEYGFRAGKYATVSISSSGDGNFNLSRIFSISSPPDEAGTLRFATIAREESDFKRKLLELEPGDILDISPPLGGFFLISDRKRPVVFITSGIGITPVASIIGNEAAEGSGRNIWLIYANHSRDDELFADEIRRYSETLNGFNMTSLASGEYMNNLKETFSLRNLEPLISGCDLKSTMFYVSGKPGFVNEVRKTLMNDGIGSASIKTERFSGY